MRMPSGGCSRGTTSKNKAPDPSTRGLFDVIGGVGRRADYPALAGAGAAAGIAGGPA